MAVASCRVDITKLPIDELPEIPLPAIVPSDRRDTIAHFDSYHRLIKVLNAWARIHLRAMAAHPQSPSHTPDSLVDDISPEGLAETRDAFYSQMGTAHHHGGPMAVAIDLNHPLLNLYLDEARFLDPERKNEDFFNIILFRPDDKDKKKDKDDKDKKKDKDDKDKKKDKDDEDKKKDKDDKDKKKKKKKDKDDKDKEKDDKEKKRKKLLLTRGGLAKEYEDLMITFKHILDLEVKKHRKIRKELKKRTAERESKGEPFPPSEEFTNEKTIYIAEMIHRLHMAHLAFKVLELVKRNCDEVFTILTFNTEPDGVFPPDVSLMLESRVEYMATTKVLAIGFVREIEKRQLGNPTYRECVDWFLKKSGRKSPKPTTPERLVYQQMYAEQSIEDELSSSPEVKEKNLKRSESKQRLLDASTEPNIDVSELMETERTDSSELDNASLATRFSDLTLSETSKDATMGIPIGLRHTGTGYSRHPSGMVYQKVYGDGENKTPVIAQEEGARASTSSDQGAVGGVKVMWPPGKVPPAKSKSKLQKFINLFRRRSGLKRSAREESKSPEQKSPPKKK